MPKLFDRLAAIEKARAAPPFISLAKVREVTTRELLAFILGSPLTEDQAARLLQDNRCVEVVTELLDTVGAPTRHVLARHRALDWARSVLRGTRP